MSKVTIQGDASGTGIFTIASPNSNTDRTLTLPDEVGTVLTSAGIPASAMPAGSVLQMVYAVVDASTEVQLSTGGTWDTATVTITPTFANSTIALFHNPSFLYRSTASSNNWLRIYGRINGANTAVIKDWSCYSDGTLVHGFRQDRPVSYFYVPGSTASQTLGFRFIQGAGLPCIVGDNELRYVWAMEIAP
jgi:hypothetical protein